MAKNSDLVAVATRTLLAAGYAISGGVHRQPKHIEFLCERPIRLGAVVRLLIAITDREEFVAEEAEDIKHAAANQSRSPVLVSALGGNDQLGWSEFLEILGGAVPAWRVLAADFVESLKTAGRNELPLGSSGEPWLLFESLVADGLEFCFGRRINRLGGTRRGRKISDMVAPLPDFDVLVVDAKASAGGFDVTWPALRPLAEYVRKQKLRQKGGGAVLAALIVSSSFQQDDSRLDGASRQFLGETRTPLCFLTTDTLGELVTGLLKTPDIRPAVSWRHVFDGGLIRWPSLSKEILSATSERCELRDK